MIKAIIFDCFGVLTTDGWLPFKKRYFSGTTELNDRAIELNKRVDAGLVGYDDFIEAISELSGVPEPEARHQIENNIADEELFSFISDYLKPHFKLGMLSNAGANWLDEIFTKDQVRLFDNVALSFQTGHIKPDPESYLMLVKQLDVKPTECIFIDDQMRYCKGAEAVGMKAILYKNLAQLKKELEDLIAK